MKKKFEVYTSQKKARLSVKKKTKNTSLANTVQHQPVRPVVTTVTVS